MTTDTFRDREKVKYRTLKPTLFSQDAQPKVKKKVSPLRLASASLMQGETL
ncbi:MAG: hypothetical protein HY673_07945 [Chloroflexi bacterium]|nr:hypothetical protein [Chloroflexota bacterium]